MTDRSVLADRCRGLDWSHHVLMACTAAVVVIDATATVRFANAAFTNLLGRADDGVVGRSAWDLLPVEVGRAATRQAPRTARLDVPEQVLTDRHGDRRRLAWTIRPLLMPTDDGPPERLVVATGVDVTRERTADAPWRQTGNTDPVTGLPDRDAALAALTAFLDGVRGVGCAVLYCHLDGFRQINDTLGPTAGDHVVTRLGQRLRTLVRDDDVVARVGGDEFVILLPAAGHLAARAVASRLEAVSRRPVRVDAAHLSVGISLGVHIADPGQDPTVALAQAQQASP